MPVPETAFKLALDRLRNGVTDLSDPGKNGGSDLADGLHRAVDGESLHANRAAGHTLRGRIERPAPHRHQMSAGAPIAADLHF